MRRFSITDFGIAQSKRCNLVFCSFVLRIDWLKPFRSDHATTCGINGLNCFICLWCNTTIATIRKVGFHHTLPFMTEQRCSSAAATSRLHQKFGIIDTSVATSDILTILTQRFPKWVPRNPRAALFHRCARCTLGCITTKVFTRVHQKLVTPNGYFLQKMFLAKMNH